MPKEKHLEKSDGVPESLTLTIEGADVKILLEAATRLSKVLRARKKRKGKESKLYVIAEVKYKAHEQEFVGQKYMVAKSMLDLGAMPGGAGKSVTEITANCKAEPGLPKCPSNNAVGQYIRKMVKEGIVFPV